MPTFPALAPQRTFCQGLTFSTPVPRNERAVSVTRDFVSDNLCAEHGASVRDRAVVTAVELLLHALLHGSGSITVTLRCEGARLWISVADGSAPSSRPVPLHLARWDAVGRACTWGVDDTAYGESLWCTLPTQTGFAPG